MHAIMSDGCGLLGYMTVRLIMVHSAVIDLTPSFGIEGTPLTDQWLEQIFLSRTMLAKTRLNDHNQPDSDF